MRGERSNASESKSNDCRQDGQKRNTCQKRRNHKKEEIRGEKTGRHQKEEEGKNQKNGTGKKGPCSERKDVPSIGKMKSVLSPMITAVHSTYHPRPQAVVDSSTWYPEASSCLPSLQLPQARARDLDPRNWLLGTSGWRRRSTPCRPIHGQRYQSAKAAPQMTT